jgi:multiple sugar transport system ATP-binding protein
VGFRPEDTDLVGPSDGGMPITVDLVEELGSDAFVHGTVAMEGQDERFVVRANPRNVPSLTEIVHVKPRANSHHAFNSATGRRI